MEKVVKRENFNFFYTYTYFYSKVYGKICKILFNDTNPCASFKINLPTNCSIAFPLVSNCLAQSSIAVRCSDRDALIINAFTRLSILTYVGIKREIGNRRVRTS